MLYTLQAGLNLYQPVNVPNYPVPTFTYGLRNMTGEHADDDAVTIYAITSQWSTISGGEPDPTKLVKITDSLAANTLPAHEHFETLLTSPAGDVFRGVAFSPCGQKGERGLGGDAGPALQGARQGRRQGVGKSVAQGDYVTQRTRFQAPLACLFAPLITNDPEVGYTGDVRRLQSLWCRRSREACRLRRFPTLFFLP